MKKKIINVPIWVKYLSDWSNEMEQWLPSNNHFILNKQCTGCGATEYYLNNNKHTILCAPRKKLLENKHEQVEKHKYQTYLLKNDGDITSIKQALEAYFTQSYNFSRCKILITYDSLGILVDCIRKLRLPFDTFQVVVDEFQLIFDDSRLKAEVELQFMQHLQYFPSVCYLSATPILEEYLDQLDEFKSLAYYELHWDESHLIRPNLEPKQKDSFYPYLKTEIDDYLSGNYPKKFDNGQIVESKQLVIFCNNVEFIKKLLVKNSGLNKDNTNIICSDSDENNSALKKIGFSIGNPPKEGESHKMFTICTKTAYIGADFYHTSARTIICSDPNIDCMSTDIATDYPQILGRLRLNTNPFQYDIVFLFKTRTRELISEEEFKHKIKQKLDRTIAKLTTFDEITEDYRRQVQLGEYRNTIKSKKYSEDYVSIIERMGQPSKPVLNKIVMFSEERGYRLQKMVYSNALNVYCALGSALPMNDQNNNDRQMFYSLFNSYSRFGDRIALFCNYADTHGLDEAKALSIDSCYFLYWSVLGSNLCQECGYSKTKMDSLVHEASVIADVSTAVLLAFTPGDSYKLKDIKNTLQQIYNDYGLNKTAKATDIEQWFEVKRRIISGIEGYSVIQKK